MTNSLMLVHDGGYRVESAGEVERLRGLAIAAVRQHLNRDEEFAHVRYFVAVLAEDVVIVCDGDAPVVAVDAVSAVAGWLVVACVAWCATVWFSAVCVVQPRSTRFGGWGLFRRRPACLVLVQV